MVRCAPLLVAMISIASAQQSSGRITPNFKDADITQITEAVAAATGKAFIIDPRVRAQVTMIASTPMSPAAFYQTYLAILQVHGFIAVPAGDVIKILPDANARQIPGLDLPDHVSSSSDEIVTQVIDVKNVSAAQLVPVLRPLIPQYGQLAAYPASNILIISDRANNVNRIIRIIRRIDQVGDQDVEVIPLQNASSAEIVRVINSLYQGQQAAEGGQPIKVVADDRSNSVLVGGDQSQRLRIRALIAHLDTPLEAGGDTQVRYLRYADAEKIAPKLKEQITGVAQASATGGAGAAGAGASPLAQAEKSAMVWADTQNNALVITAPPKIMRAVMSILDKLDIRRPQVLVEALIVEVNTDKTAAFGVNWAEFSKGNGTVPAASFVSPVNGSSIVDLANSVAGLAAGTATSASLPTGATIAVGRLAAGGLNFAAMISAIRGDSDSNVISTPSTMTLDNQEAEIKVADEVPFITGSFTNTGSGNVGSVNPFQTVQREEVGTILKVTPQIAAEGHEVVMKISIESSSVLPVSSSSVDITTSKRTITTNVLIDDGGIVVLGGLISNNHNSTQTKVPILGSIPLLGNLFKTRSAEGKKTNLMIFIRPKILRDANQAALQTDSKYNYMLNEEMKYNKGELDVPILPRSVQKPLLPPAPAIPPPGSSPAAAASPEEKARAAREQEEYDAAVVKKLQRATKPGSVTPPVVPLPQPPAGSVATPPAGATTHPDGEPPYATEPPGVLMPPSAPQPTTPPEGGKP
ncbi:MAG: ral secretion pathway protein [Gammaproteobacteria bacterium]|jgi:general secretion pathway protein D|nr:ral secretion pathway protein [Gammaproteobacteria bacterium]